MNEMHIKNKEVEFEESKNEEIKVLRK